MSVHVYIQTHILVFTHGALFPCFSAYLFHSFIFIVSLFFLELYLLLCSEAWHEGRVSREDLCLLLKVLERYFFKFFLEINVSEQGGLNSGYTGVKAAVVEPLGSFPSSSPPVDIGCK